MKRVLLPILSALGMMAMLSCCNKEPAVSPLELMVKDYVANSRHRDYLNSESERNDTLFLHVNFSTGECTAYGYHVTDSLYKPKISASVGGTPSHLVYPVFSWCLWSLPIPPPPPPMPDVIQEVLADDVELTDENREVIISHIAESEVPYEFDSLQYCRECLAHEEELCKWEKYVFGESKPRFGAFHDYKEVLERYENRVMDLWRTADSLNLLSPYLIGYTTFGRVHVIVLADEDVDRKVVDKFLQGVEIHDLRPRYVYHKKYEEEVQYCGWGSFIVYGVEPDGQFKPVGRYVID